MMSRAITYISWNTSVNVAKIKFSGKADVDAVADALWNAIVRESTPVERIDHRSAGDVMYVMIFEKFYFRTTSTTSLTIVVSGDGSDVKVIAVATGGKAGLLMLSYGSEKQFAGIVRKTLAQYGLTEIA